MGRIIEAIYENGVLKPCGKIRLENKRKYKLMIGIGLERFFGIFKGKIYVDKERDLKIEERLS